MRVRKDEDEFFLVIQGPLNIKMRDREIQLKAGEVFIVSMGVEHIPYANEEVHVLLFELKAAVNTGDTVSEKTVEDPERI